MIQSWMVASAIDNTGLIIGPIGHGIAFADTAAPESTAVTESVPMGTEASPNTGPISGKTAITDGYSAGSTFNATGLEILCRKLLNLRSSDFR